MVPAQKNSFGEDDAREDKLSEHRIEGTACSSAGLRSIGWFVQTSVW